MNAVDCSLCRESIAAFSCGDYTSEEKNLIDRHIAICRDCASDYRALIKLNDITLQPERDTTFNVCAEASARRAINAIQYIERRESTNARFQSLRIFRYAAILLIGCGLGISSVKLFDADNDALSQFSSSRARAGSSNNYIDFLERSHLLLLGASSCKPDCSDPDYTVILHQRRISIDLLLEAQYFRNLPNIKLQPRELLLISNIETALMRVAEQGITDKRSSVGEASGLAVCEISRRLGI